MNSTANNINTNRETNMETNNAYGCSFELPADQFSSRVEYKKKQMLLRNGAWVVITDISRPKGSGWGTYTFRLATEAEISNRAGRVELRSAADAEHAVGRVYEIGGEFLLVAKVETRRVNSAGLSLPTYWGVGRFVDADKAAKAKAKWDKVNAARIAESESRHKQRMDSGF